MKNLVLIHSIASLLAFVLALLIFYNNKYTKLHKILGRYFALFMGLGTLSSLFLSSLVSPILSLFSLKLGYLHILSLFNFYWLLKGIYFVRKKPKNWLFYHAKYMSSCFVGLTIASFGVFGRHAMKNSNNWLYFLIVGAILTSFVHSIFLKKLKSKLYKD